MLLPLAQSFGVTRRDLPSRLAVLLPPPMRPPDLAPEAEFTECVVATCPAAPFIVALLLLASCYGIRSVRIFGYNLRAIVVIELKHLDQVLLLVSWVEQAATQRDTGYSLDCVVHRALLLPLLLFNALAANYSATTQDSSISTKDLVTLRLHRHPLPPEAHLPSSAKIS